MRVLIVFLAIVLAIQGYVLAEEQPRVEGPNKRWMQVMIWKGDRLEMETYIPVMPGYPAQIVSTSGGSTVPEGMAPARQLVKCLVKVDYRETKSASEQGSEGLYAEVLARSQHFSLGEIDLSIFSSSGDRLCVGIYNQGLTEAAVMPILEVGLSAFSLPYGGHSADESQDRIGYLEAWIVGSLVENAEPMYIYPPPAPHSVTVREE